MARDASDDVIATVLQVQALTLASRYGEALATADLAMPGALALGKPGVVARLHEMSGFARCRLGQAGWLDLEQAARLYRDAGNHDDAIRTRFQMATMHIEAGQARVAAPLLEEVGAYWQSLDNRAMLASLANNQALLRLLSGDLAAAYTMARKALQQARDAGYPMLEVATKATLAEAAADCDYQEVAAEASAHALDDATRLGLGSSANAARRAQIAVLLARRDRSGARRLIDAARATVLSPVDAALLDLADGQLALRSLANAHAAAALATAAERLITLSRPHHAGRALLCLAEAYLRLGHIGQATEALNRIPELMDGLGSDGHLIACARQTPLVLARRRVLRQLRRRSRLLLDRLAAGSGEGNAIRGTSAPPPTLRLSPFGQGAGWLDVVQLDLAGLRLKARELLFYSVHAGSDLGRDSLLEAVWSGDAGADQAFWNAGRDLRRLIGERTWGPRGGRYGLRLRVESTERDFEHCAALALGDGAECDRLAAAERALAILGDGQYLPWCESEWAAAARTRLVALGIQVALAAADIAQALGRPADAQSACRRAIALDPLGEEPRRVLIRSLRGQGQAAQARAEYDAYSTVLAEELGVAPPSDLRSLVAAKMEVR